MTQSQRHTQYTATKQLASSECDGGNSNRTHTHTSTNGMRLALDLTALREQKCIHKQRTQYTRTHTGAIGITQA